MKATKIYLVFICVSILGLISCDQKKEQKIESVIIVQPKIILDLLDLQKKNKLGKDTLVTVNNDPVYHKTKKYQAVNAVNIIKREIDLSKIDVKNTVIIFECIDGYKPEMPLELFLQAKPYLAFKDADAPKDSNWERIIKNGNEMNADPFYLVYTSSIATTNQEYKWPYNVIKFQLVSKNINNALEPKNDEKATKGFVLYQKYCITCHAINGIGGEMGPELNYPKNVTEYWKETELVDYIVNPASFRHKVKMPTLGITKQQSQEIVDYLKYMSEHKKKI
ncbi:cytochrome c family protein [Flavobacterium sp. 5]|uniref:c-type cytochrome n=1 Tax=Flavobacterium sp. 5 TaxID=2035199 RepID=UPI000CB314A6|nr:c-type cytochrome [Flavobacterium sp. 5]PKB18119.1 cytochrome c2 [Flavobacterium sp. 5]